MSENLNKKIQNLMKTYTYYKTDGTKAIYIPLRAIEEKFDNPEEIIKVLRENNCHIIDICSLENVRTYDHEKLLDEIDDNNIIISDKRKAQIIGKIEKIAADSQYTTEYEHNNTIIPHHKILYLNLMPWELDFAYQYIDSRGYTIRGIDLTILDELDNFFRSATNKKGSEDVLTKPYSKAKRKRKLKELADLKKEIDELTPIVEQTNDFKLNVKFKKLENKYYDLRAELLEHNLRLVYKYIIEYELRGQDIKDKILVAYEAYILGFDDYIKQYYDGNKDSVPAKEYELSTFVYNKIKWYLQKVYILEKENVTKSLHAIEKLKKLKQDINKLLEENNDIYSIEDLPINLLEQLHLLNPDIISLDEVTEEILASAYSEQISSHDLQRLYSDIAFDTDNTDIFSSGYAEDGILLECNNIEEQIIPITQPPTSLTFMDEYYDENNPEQVANYHNLQNIIKNAVKELPEREKMVIELRYGLRDDNPLSLREIGDEIGLSGERIRAIEGKTLAKLKLSKKAKKFKNYMGH